MRIGITDNQGDEQSFDAYRSWIRDADPSVEIVRLSHQLQNLNKVDEIDGLLLTGGGDVDPYSYGKEDAEEKAEDVDVARDQFEFEAISRALEKELPILGICRGMQVMNVYLGGTLHVDLRSAGFQDHARQKGIERHHAVEPTPLSLLEAVVGEGKHNVNSSHHQASEKLGRGLMVSALSEDGVIEAAEWILKDRTPFLLLVQWHPERLKGTGDPCSKNIAEYFLRESTRYSFTNNLDDNKKMKRS